MSNFFKYIPNLKLYRQFDCYDNPLGFVRNIRNVDKTAIIGKNVYILNPTSVLRANSHITTASARLEIRSKVDLHEGAFVRIGDSQMFSILITHIDMEFGRRAKFVTRNLTSHVKKEKDTVKSFIHLGECSVVELNNLHMHDNSNFVTYRHSKLKSLASNGMLIISSEVFQIYPRTKAIIDCNTLELLNNVTIKSSSSTNVKRIIISTKHKGLAVIEDSIIDLDSFIILPKSTAYTLTLEEKEKRVVNDITCFKTFYKVKLKTQPQSNLNDKPTHLLVQVMPEPTLITKPELLKVLMYDNTNLQLEN